MSLDRDPHPLALMGKVYEPLPYLVNLDLLSKLRKTAESAFLLPQRHT